MEFFTDLTVVWAFLIAFAVLAYVVLDGFDLGIGMLFALSPDQEERNVMMNTVAPVWDGNETWLVLGGAGLLAAFPLAYALILPALYAPLIAMLLALVFRGVAFEFRWRSRRWRPLWDLGFICGSSVATLAQGIALGALLKGIAVDEASRSYVGGWFDWLSPFTLLSGVALVAGYCLLGATWLVMKTTGPLQARMRRLARGFALATIGFIGAVSVATPFLQQGYYYRWFSGWGIPLAALVALAVAGTGLALWRSLGRDGGDRLPFLLSLGLFALCFAGLGVCMWPYAVPTEVTIWEAAAPAESQLFMLVGAAVLIPLTLGYTAYTYWVFRGKVDAGTGYH